jgi:hypothetical protein
MSFFIHNENQILLWNIINKTEEFKVFFQGSQQDPNYWFKNIIQKFYQEHPIITKQELMPFNRKVISFMINNLNQNRITKVIPNTESTIELETKSQQSNNFIDHNYLQQKTYNETKEELFQKQFMERQQQYDSMFKKPSPPAVNFGNNIKDEAISNMDELILVQKKMREEELKSILPPITEVMDLSSNTKTTNNNIDNVEISCIKEEILIINAKINRIEEEFMKFSELLQQLNNSTANKT